MTDFSWEPSEFRDGQRKCDHCRSWNAPNQMIAVDGVGRFCNEDCAQAGVLDHQQFLARMHGLRKES